MDILSLLKKPGRLRSLLGYYEYGVMPPPPKHLRASDIVSDTTFAAGKAELVSVTLECEMESGEWHKIDIRYALPLDSGRHPAFIHIKGDLNMPDRHQPTEEICDGGFAVVSIGVEEPTAEARTRSRRLARALRGGERRYDAPGSLTAFAWCAMRAVDYLCGLDAIDSSRLYAVGHGIYGTAALLAAAHDGRIAGVITNSAGPSGVVDRIAARSELFELKTRRGDLFCRRFYKLSGREEELPFAGDALLALIAPRPVLLDNADSPLSRCAELELRAAIAASRYYEALGARGLVIPRDIDPFEATEFGKEACFADGALAYRKRVNLPYLSREDWRVYMNFASKGGKG